MWLLLAQVRKASRLVVARSALQVAKCRQLSQQLAAQAPVHQLLVLLKLLAPHLSRLCGLYQQWSSRGWAGWQMVGWAGAVFPYFPGWQKWLHQNQRRRGMWEVHMCSHRAPRQVCPSTASQLRPCSSQMHHPRNGSRMVHKAPIRGQLASSSSSMWMPCHRGKLACRGHSKVCRADRNKCVLGALGLLLQRHLLACTQQRVICSN